MAILTDTFLRLLLALISPPNEEDKVNKMAAMRTRGETLITFLSLLLALPRPFKGGRQGKKSQIFPMKTTLQTRWPPFFEHVAILFN